MYLTRPFTFMGFDFIAEIEYRVTYWGCAAKTYGPPENCYPAESAEWEVESIHIAWDSWPDGFECEGYPFHETTGALFNSLAEHFAPAIEQAIDEYEPDYDN